MDVRLLKQSLSWQRDTIVLKCGGLKCDLASKCILLLTMGPGILLHHPFGITVHPDAVIGEMVTLFKGSTIGRVRSGKRKGVPKIGDRVIISLNATVVGGITVGSDVLIAANSFVDFDVPDGSLVIGNPGKIVFRKNPVNDYIQ